MSYWNHISSGGILIGYWAIGVDFFRFRRRTHDRFFAIFGFSFWLLAFERFLLILIGPTEESRWFIYIIWLVAFLLILYAIYDKNLSRIPRGAEPVKSAGVSEPEKE
jgi:hypothetical protein